MRVTNQMVYTSSQYDYRRTMGDMYKVDQQLSSGIKIQNGYENSSIFVDTMRLDYDLTTLSQVTKGTSKAQSFADNSDKTINQLTDLITKIKTKLIAAANTGSSSVTSMQAIGNDIKALRESLITVSNTSINGQFLFSGTAMDQRPISANGDYHGNDKTVKTVAGSGVKMPFNIPGSDLFLGKDSDYGKILKTNVRLTDQLEPEKHKAIKENSTIEQLVGDYEGNTVFYLQGRKPNGETFRERFELTPDSKMSDLLKTIGEKYGNTEDNVIVKTKMNKDGQIMIEDNEKGNSLLEFNLVALTDTAAAAGAAGTASSDDPASLITATPTGITPNAGLKLTEFIKSDFKDSDGNALNPFSPDRATFDKNGKHVTGNSSQVIKDTSNFATNSTKLSEVSGGSLVGNSFTMNITDISGNPQEVTLSLGNPTPPTTTPPTPPTFSTFRTYNNATPPVLTTYNILDAEGNNTHADNMTYRQLNDIISMVTSRKLPATTTSSADYNTAIKDARGSVEVNMDYRGRIDIVDRYNSVSRIQMSMYNTNSGNFAAPPATSPSSNLTFSKNDALVEDEPHVDIFKDIDKMVEAVMNQLGEADGDSKYKRNPGIESAIKRIEHINDHIIKQHTKIGVVSNALGGAKERSELLSVNVKTVQSKIIDTDFGESYLKLNQLAMSYQAILQTASKINKLSLVNYM